MTVRVACDQPAPATVVCHAGTQYQPLGQLTVPLTGSRYSYTEVSVRLRDLTAKGPADLYLVLDGPVRLAAFRGAHP